MKFFWRYVWNKLRDIGNEPEEHRPEMIGSVTKVGRRVGDIEGDDQGLNITVRQALGGKIVSFRHHDTKTDRYFYKTYVVPEDLDFERELGKMITMESMRM
jgi:hypothetical protein